MKPISADLKDKLSKRKWTKAEGLEPKLEVLLTKPRSAIVDSDYFIVETIRERRTLGDIAVAPRRLKVQESPDRIYDVHVDNGKVETWYKDYPDDLEKGWQAGKILEGGSEVAIAFDGHWERLGARWILVTEDEPYIFWRATNGAIYCQKWNDDSTRLKLVDSAHGIKAIRAWRSVADPLDDQGIVLAYTKSDKKLYYRNFCTQADGTKIWEGEKTVATDYEVQNLNLFLTNDYRLGVLVRDPSGYLHYELTDRNWAGMGVEPEFVEAEISASIDFIEIVKKQVNANEYVDANVKALAWLSYIGTDNEILKAYNVDDGTGDHGKIVECKTKNDIRKSQVEDWELVDSNGNAASPLTYSTTIGRIHFLRFANINNFVGELTLKYKGVHGVNANDTKYSAMEVQFLPSGLVPVIIPPPTLTNEGALIVRATFTHGIIDTADLISALSLTSEGYIDTRRTETATDTHEIVAVEIENANTLKLTLTPETRLKRAKDLKLVYNEVKGKLKKESGELVGSFVSTCSPSGFEFVSDIYAAEYVNADITASIDFIYITTKQASAREYVNATISATVDLIKVEDLNP